MLEAALLWYNEFRKDLEAEGFKFNPYDPCVGNKIVREEQFTIRFHVDDLMSSHMDPAVNMEFLKFLNDKYGKHTEVKSTRGFIHEYLGMTLEFRSGRLIVDMVEYVKNMLEEFPIKFKAGEIVANPATSNMFESSDDKHLETEERELFHRTTAKALFL